MSPPPETTKPPDLLKLVRRQPALAGLVAVVIAGAAQYALVGKNTLFAIIGYVVAVVIFFTALRDFVPDNPEVEEPKPEPEVGAGLAPAPTAPAASTPAPGKFGFWSNWRQYTLADLLQGKSPIPSAPTAEASAAPSTPESTTPPVSAPVADVGQREVVNLPASVAAPVMDAGQIANLPPPVVDAGQRQAAALPPVQVRQVVNLPSLSYWTGFAEPAAIATTAQGHVLVVDAGQKIIFRFNADGQPLGQWPVAELPSSPNYNLAASPDGKTLYIADPANRRVQVISL